jgi:hypothetical protein
MVGKLKVTARSTHDILALFTSGQNTIASRFVPNAGEQIFLINDAMVPRNSVSEQVFFKTTSFKSSR